MADADPIDDRSVNIYRNSVRCENLHRWLSTFDDTPRSLIFIGEAPGRDGGVLTGLPFVSPQVMMHGSDPWGVFGNQTDYILPVGTDPSQRERTATRFWKHVPRVLAKLPRPLTWNIYPFWPFEVTDNGIRRNRAPTKQEIDNGSQWLRAIIEMHPRSQPVAVGIKARDTLSSAGIVDAPTIPHPSRGSDFALIASI